MWWKGCSRQWLAISHVVAEPLLPKIDDDEFGRTS